MTLKCKTCVLAFLVYIMHSSYKSTKVRKGTKKRFLKYSMIYILGLPLLFQICMISLDFRTGEYHNVILPNGYYNCIPESTYITSCVPVTNIFE